MNQDRTRNAQPDAGEIAAESLEQVVGGGARDTAIEVTDYGFGVTAPVTTSRSDGGGATVGKASS